MNEVEDGGEITSGSQRDSNKCPKKEEDDSVSTGLIIGILVVIFIVIIAFLVLMRK